MTKGGGKAGSSNTNRFNAFDNSAQSQVEDATSPFYINNSDYPGLNVVSHILEGGNYNSWNRAMTMALTTKNKMFFMNGSILRSSQDDSVYNSWIRCNSLVCSCILNSVSKDIAESLMYVDNAHKM